MPANPTLETLARDCAEKLDEIQRDERGSSCEVILSTLRKAVEPLDDALKREEDRGDTLVRERDEARAALAAEKQDMGEWRKRAIDLRAQLATAGDDALEEAAKIRALFAGQGDGQPSAFFDGWNAALRTKHKAIRALKSKPAPHAVTVGGGITDRYGSRPAFVHGEERDTDKWLRERGAINQETRKLYYGCGAAAERDAILKEIQRQRVLYVNDDEDFRDGAGTALDGIGVFIAARAESASTEEEKPNE